jgi:hypothetical protein
VCINLEFEKKSVIQMKMPSEVLSSLSPGGGLCRKNPFERKAVTMPLVVTVCPASGDASPEPWIWPMEIAPVQLGAAPSRARRSPSRSL